MHAMWRRQLMWASLVIAGAVILPSLPAAEGQSIYARRAPDGKVTFSNAPTEAGYETYQQSAGGSAKPGAAPVSGCDDASLHTVHALLDSHHGDSVVLRDAQADLAKILKANPNCALGYVELARAITRAGFIRGHEYDPAAVAAALRAVDHALSLAPDLFEAHLQRAYVALKQNDVAAARRSLERAAALRPGDPRVDLLAAVIADFAGDDAEAERRVPIILRNSADPVILVTAYEILAGIYQRNEEFDRADDAWKHIIAIDSNPWTKNDYAILLMKAEQFDRSIEMARSALAEMEFPAGHRTLSQAIGSKGEKYEADGDLRQAVTLYQEAMDADPTYATVRDGYIRVCYFLADREHDQRWSEKAVAVAQRRQGGR